MDLPRYLSIILDASPEALRIVDAILICSAASKEVASNTFNFWCVPLSP
jgi:hypothetical protein